MSGSSVVDMMDKVIEGLGLVKQAASCSERSTNLPMVLAYCAFGMWATFVWHMLTDKDFSTVLTMSSIAQLMGFVLLSMKVRWAQSAAGLSSRSLEMYIVFFMFRLSSTIIKNGYLPIDRSGDWVYQSADVLSVFVVMHLLYMIHKTYKQTYQAQYDTLDLLQSLPACMLLAIFVKGDLNGNAFFDWVWATSLLVDTLAMLPQLWMMTKIGGQVDGMTSHYVMSLFVSRGCAFAFWWVGFNELHIKGQSFNKAGYTVLGCHILMLLFCADFMFYYLKGMLSGRGVVELPNIEI